MPIHSDRENLGTAVYSTLNRAEELLLLTDTNVAAANTIQGLIDAVNAVQVHADQENWRQNIIRAIRVSGLGDADILSLTTVAGLVALLGVTATTSQEVLA